MSLPLSFRLAAAALVLSCTLACSSKEQPTIGAVPARPTPPPLPPSRVVYIDLDDHGLSALWNSQSPHLQQMAREGVLAFSRVDIPTHSNQSNLTLLTGAFPEVTGVPHNSWLDRQKGYKQPFDLNGQLSAGSYIYYDQNPLTSRVQSIYDGARASHKTSSYVGMLPPWEHGADDVHFTIFGSQLGGMTIDKTLTDFLLGSMHYPQSVIDTFHEEGPPPQGIALNRFTLEQAAKIFDDSTTGGKVPDLMFVWTFLALEDDPTSVDGADGAGVRKIVEEIDQGVGSLLAAVQRAGLESTTSYVVTLDHGKVNTTQQVALESQLQAQVVAQGALHGGITMADVRVLDEEGDGQLYAAVEGAGTPAGAARQMEVTHALVDIVQSGAIVGLDTRRTLTWDGYLGTRRYHDIRSSGPANSDVIVFPQDDYTLNDLAKTGTPGSNGRSAPFGRHGGISKDELYVPAIFFGPAFAKGRLLQHIIDHVDIAPTVLAALGSGPIGSAQGTVISAALANDSTPALLLPADPNLARDLVLQSSGFVGSTPALVSPPAAGAILLDVSGVWSVAGASAPALDSLYQRGTVTLGMRTRYHDLPVNQYHLLTGTYPVRLPWVPFAEGDPAQTSPPGAGLFAMPQAPQLIADPAGFSAWHEGNERFEDSTVFAAAHDLGLTTVAVGNVSSHLAHLPLSGAAPVDIALPDSPVDAVGTTLQDHRRAFVLVGIDGGNDARAAADATLSAIDSILARQSLTGSYLVALVSSGAPIELHDPQRPETMRSAAPFALAGPNVSAGKVVGGPSTLADVGPTLLFALGVKAQPPDIAYGVALDGGPAPGGAQATGRTLPVPSSNREGRVLVPFFAR